MNIEELLETIKDRSRDYVGMNGCLYQDITREELDLIVNEIERLNNIINELEKELKTISFDEKYEYTEYNKGVNASCIYILEKLQELKENK